MIEEKYITAQEALKYKLIMVGDPCVGKTALFYRYTEG